MGVAKGGVSPSPSSSSLSSPRSISWLIYATRRRRQLATICRKQKRQIEIAQLGRRKNGGEENKIVNKISAGRLVAHCYPFRRCFIEHPALSQFESVSESESESQALFPRLSQSLSASISQSSVLPFLRIEFAVQHFLFLSQSLTVTLLLFFLHNAKFRKFLKIL